MYTAFVVFGSNFSSHRLEQISSLNSLLSKLCEACQSATQNIIQITKGQGRRLLRNIVREFCKIILKCFNIAKTPYLPRNYPPKTPYFLTLFRNLEFTFFFKTVLKL